MTNDQQQVEAWRIEFEATVDKPHLLQKFPSGNYHWDSTEWMWAGFQRAKRTMPVIDVPEGDSDGMVDLGEVYAAITAAGYQYKVKE